MNLIYTHTAIPTAREIARGEKSSIRFRVFGYWSQDSINIYIRYHAGLGNELEINVTHSSGGRDTKEVSEDFDAEENFGKALIAAAEMARGLMSLKDEVAAEYKVYREELRVEADREKALREAKIAADPAMTVQTMSYLIEEAKAGRTVTLFERGSDRPHSRITHTGKFFYHNGNMVSKKDLVEKMITLANRFTVEGAV